MSLVKVSGLSKSFGNKRVVDGLSFSIEEGDVYGFLGQNGAGKSTTIRMLLTLISPTEGDIELFGLNLRTHRRDILRQVGAVIEKPDLYKYLSGIENLSLFAKMGGLKAGRKQLLEQLEIVGLADRADDKVRTYSQGMKQRLGIAVALVQDPKLIVLDEPTNGLDPQGIADIRNLILHLSRHRKKTILVSSHLLNEIEQVANRMIIIDKGKKLIEGEVAALLDPAQTVVEAEVADPENAATVIGNSEWAGFLQEVSAAGLVFRLPRHRIPELNRSLVDLNINVFSLQVKNALETYFLSLTTNRQHVVPFTN